LSEGLAGFDPTEIIDGVIQSPPSSAAAASERIGLNQIGNWCVCSWGDRDVRKVVLSAAALVIALGPIAAYVAADNQVETKSIAATPGDTLVVQSDFGKIRIQASGVSEVQARIEKVAGGKIASEFQVAAQKSGREIYLYSFFSGQPQESVNFDIQAPRFLNVVIWGANPQVEVQGLDGSVRVQNISGSIAVEDLTSSVTVATDRGNIRYRANVQPRGDVHLETTNGNVVAELVDTLNLRAWMRAGGSIVWDREPPAPATSVERQVGSFGPLLNIVSLRGNVQVSLLSPGARPSSASPPAVEPRAQHDQGANPGPAPRVEPTPPDTRARTAPAAASRAGAPGSSTTATSGGMEIKVNVASVLLNVSVRDQASNRSIAGLRQDDFRIYEDGVPQEIQQFMPSEAPFDLLLLLDVSGSTESFIGLMKKAATEFTREIRPNDRVSVATFNDGVQLLQDFTNDRQAAERAISKIHSRGGTAFYDALMTCVDDYMRGIEGRKAIVVFTDGVDNQLEGRGQGSTTTFQTLYRRIQEIDTIIYTILLDSEGQMRMTRGGGGYPGGGRYPRQGGSFPFPFPFPTPSPSPYPSPSPSPYPGGRDERAAYDTARQQLETIADQTGGRMYSPRRAEDLSGVYSEIADDLRVQYLLAYASTNQEEDNAWRAIRVQIKDRPGAVVRTRKGYYANGARATASRSGR
jgi:Ca-activated chloride channel homolog